MSMHQVKYIVAPTKYIVGHTLALCIIDVTLTLPDALGINLVYYVYDYDSIYEDSSRMSFLQ